MLKGVSVGLMISLAVIGPAADYNPAGGFCGKYYEATAEFESYLERVWTSIQTVRTQLYESSSEMKESGQISLQDVYLAASLGEILRSREWKLYQGYQFAKFCDWFKMISE